MTLDLSANVTREQYEASVTGLTAYLAELSVSMGWCSERHRYFAAIVPEYYSYARDEYANFALVPDDADYAARLRNMRARVLWYVNAGTIALSYANEGFRAANWPEYVPDAKSGLRFHVYLPALQVSVTDTGDGYAQEYVRNHLTELIVAALDNRTVEGNRYIPGSATFNESGAEVYTINDGHTFIPTDETLRPSYR